MDYYRLESLALTGNSLTWQGLWSLDMGATWAKRVVKHIEVGHALTAQRKTTGSVEMASQSGNKEHQLTHSEPWSKSGAPHGHTHGASLLLLEGQNILVNATICSPCRWSWT